MFTSTSSTIIETKPRVISTLDISITFEELAKDIKTGIKRPDIKALADKTLVKVSKIWKPSIVYNWYPYSQSQQINKEQYILDKNKKIKLNLGHSSQFLKDAHYVLVAAYTVGKEIENTAKNEPPIITYIIDLIGLHLLGKIGEIVKQIVEVKAQMFSWGVSPFLSPGSIHGWELEEQLKLCSLLPLHNIGLEIKNDAVLRPFKSLTCLIGIGPEYQNKKVGTTCKVCSRRHKCDMHMKR